MKFCCKEIVAFKNCEKQDSNSEILQVKLALPSKLLTMYLKKNEKLISINNCQFYVMGRLVLCT